MTNKKSISLIILLVILVMFIIFLPGRIYNMTRIHKVLTNSYDEIKCLNSKCTYIYAKEEKKSKNSYKVFDFRGKLIIKYNIKKNVYPYEVTRNYILSKDKNKDVYYISNHNKILYKTKNKLEKINNDFIKEVKQGDYSVNDYLYSIVNKKGDVIYEDATTLDTYNDGKIISFKSTKDSYILDEKLNVLLKNYSIQEELKENRLVVRDEESMLYYTYDLNRKKLSDSYVSYKYINNNLKITRKEDGKNVIYDVKENGKEVKTNEKVLGEIVNNIKKKINTKEYRLYTNGIEENDDNVLVDNLKDKSFGILNIKTKKYKELYKYTSDKFFSELTDLESKDKNYIEIVCTSDKCSENKMLVYLKDDNKVLLELTGDEFTASEFIGYENNYKVVKYNARTTNEEYKNKYVLYDDKNKELVKSTNKISVIDSKLLIGEEEKNNVLLYSAKKKKLFNDDSNLAKTVKLDKDYYKYSTDKKDVILKENGEEYFTSDKNSSLSYSKTNIFVNKEKSLKIYNLGGKLESVYTLTKNESLNTNTLKKMDHVKDLTIINNKNKKYIKVINKNKTIVRKLNGVSASSFKYNDELDRGYLITVSTKDKKLKYGAYLVK